MQIKLTSYSKVGREQKLTKRKKIKFTELE